jgi:hypothetical protein
MASADWTPVLSPDGITYCSPRCGFGCKKADYDAAVIEADALALRMGNGWQPEILESGGRWHITVAKGDTKITVHPDFRGTEQPTTYMAWIEPGVTLRQHVMQFICSANTPEDALGFAVQEARTTIHRINEALALVIE